MTGTMLPTEWVEVARVLWLAAPVMVAGAVHIAVIRLRLLEWLACPIDGGIAFRGVPIFGDHKTWRGALVMVLSSGAAMAVQGLVRIPAFEFFDYGMTSTVAVGMLLGCGFVAAELPNSFLKRRADIPPGGHGHVGFVVIDHIDSVIGCLVALCLVWVPPFRVWVIALVAGPLVHLAFNVMFVLLGLKRSAW